MKRRTQTDNDTLFFCKWEWLALKWIIALLSLPVCPLKYLLELPQLKQTIIYFFRLGIRKSEVSKARLVQHTHLVLQLILKYLAINFLTDPSVSWADLSTEEDEGIGRHELQPGSSSKSQFLFSQNEALASFMGTTGN